MPEIRIVDTSGLEPGFDIADAVAEGWSTQRIIEFCKARVRPWTPPVEPPKLNGHHHPAADATEPESAPAPRRKSVKEIRAAVKAETIPAAQHTNEDDDTPGRYQSYAALGLACVKGHPHPNLNNAAAILERHPELVGRWSYDEFAKRIMSTWDSEPGTEREWADYDTVNLTLWIQRVLGIQKIAKNTVEDAVIAYARSRTRNPCRDWLRSLKWDGVQRAHTLMCRGFGARPTAYAESVSVYFLCAMAKRVLEPGSQVDSLPVLEGNEGMMKSSALRALAGNDFFAEYSGNIFDKDFCLALQGKMLVEIAEMHSFTGNENMTNATKGVISCRVDRYRPPYGRASADHPRCNVFAGTTNRTDWNKSDSGARRFFPIKVGDVDLAWIGQNRDQLFAEAVHLLTARPLWWAVPVADARIEQDARRDHDSWESPVAAWLVGRSRVKTGDVLAECLKIELGRQTQQDQRRVGRVLKALGWENTVKRVGMRTERFWAVPQGQTEQF